MSFPNLEYPRKSRSVGAVSGEAQGNQVQQITPGLGSVCKTHVIESHPTCPAYLYVPVSPAHTASLHNYRLELRSPNLLHFGAWDHKAEWGLDSQSCLGSMSPQRSPPEVSCFPCTPFTPLCSDLPASTVLSIGKKNSLRDLLRKADFLFFKEREYNENSKCRGVLTGGCNVLKIFLDET